MTTSSTTRLTVRHSVSTKFICGLNKRLSKEQRALIGGTPFGWFLDFTDALKKGKATTNVYVDGCIYMLQAWLFEKLIPPKGPIEKNPRILHWMYLKLGDNILTQALESGVVNVDVDVDVGRRKDEKDFKDQARGKNKDEKASTKKELKKNRRERFMETLHEQQSLVAELKRRVLVLEEEVAFEKHRRRRPQDGGDNVAHEEPSLSPRGMSPGGISPGGIPFGAQSEQGMSSGRPAMKTFVRMGSRRRYKSKALRTPYVGLVRKKLD
ncbi:uncharacterized protein LOC111241029 isoform X2 [Vigna radiata var. radiata]|uniref:Uncharacterized protein LOC111241029 isoform X2 n=1 Tax=Vigna radiata var. radiata TaxID=3916 RepID=A0A3Q0EN79_VIGRR|nr:uncharacterized protein LOC111241029 isoform X2 [Vigna radiata var. radiata]